MNLAGNIELKNIEKIKSGKIREMFSLGSELLIVTTDRISAFDFILPSLIPFKGILLNQLSLFWFNSLEGIIKNHLIETEFNDFPDNLQEYKSILNKRSVIVKKADIIPLECVVRGYITGSAWEDYKKTGKVCGISLPSNLKFSGKLPKPIFTPTTKAEEGHDMPISIKEAKNLYGSETVDFLEKKSIEIFLKAGEYALEKEIIIADTKFEFGYYDGEIIICDEVLTPDSSRFWPLNDYKEGENQKSFDKQFVRDYLLSSDWDRKSVPPKLPSEVIEKTSERYMAAYEKITGSRFEINF